MSLVLSLLTSPLRHQEKVVCFPLPPTVLVPPAASWCVKPPHSSLSLTGLANVQGMQLWLTFAAPLHVSTWHVPSGKHIHTSPTVWHCLPSRPSGWISVARYLQRLNEWGGLPAEWQDHCLVWRKKTTRCHYFSPRHDSLDRRQHYYTESRDNGRYIYTLCSNLCKNRLQVSTGGVQHCDTWTVLSCCVWSQTSGCFVREKQLICFCLRPEDANWRVSCWGFGTSERVWVRKPAFLLGSRSFQPDSTRQGSACLLVHHR